MSLLTFKRYQLEGKRAMFYIGDRDRMLLRRRTNTLDVGTFIGPYKRRFQAARLGPDSVGSGVVPPSAPWIHSPVKMPPFGLPGSDKGNTKKGV